MTNLEQGVIGLAELVEYMFDGQEQVICSELRTPSVRHSKRLDQQRVA
jgi:hypothetical protein